jgi:plastocyanin
MRRLAFILAIPLLLSTGAAPPADWVHAQPVTVTLSNFKFAPATLTLQRGRAYRIHLVNSASGGHNFMARDFFAQAEVASEDRAKLNKGGVDVRGHGAVDIRLVPRQSGTYRVRCTHFMHSSFGMTGTLVVQ